MLIYFAGDHAGFEMKQKLMEFVRSLGHEVEDMGPHSYNPQDDYVDFVVPLAKRVASYSPLSKGALPSSAGGMLTPSVTVDGDTSLIREDTTPAPHFSEKVGGTPFIKGDKVRGIVVAGSGQGEIIAMNRIRAARAALLCPCHRTQINADTKTQMDADTDTQINADEEDADVRRCNVSHDLIRASRAHNDSNILALGARFCTLDEAKQGVKLWLETPFSGEERHIRRLRKIEDITGH